MFILADITEKPTPVTIIMLPALFILVGICCWFYALQMRTSKGDRWWRWVFAYGFMAFALYVSTASLLEVMTNSFAQALVDSRRALVSYYAGVGLSLFSMIFFGIWHYLRVRFKHGELSY